MPMFYTPKPRQFHYQPRFYDPEKEKWEALKAKYALEREWEEHEKRVESGDRIVSVDEPNRESDNSELSYFQQRV